MQYNYINNLSDYGRKYSIPGEHSSSGYKLYKRPHGMHYKIIINNIYRIDLRFSVINKIFTLFCDNGHGSSVYSSLTQIFHCKHNTFYICQNFPVRGQINPSLRKGLTLRKYHPPTHSKFDKSLKLEIYFPEKRRSVFYQTIFFYDHPNYQQFLRIRIRQ